MPEDTKALSTGILDDHEYLEQALFVLEERLRLYDYELNRFESGFLFFYFSSLDLNSHMFWRTLDPQHPLYEKEHQKEFGWVIPHIYDRMDEVIGKALARCDDDTLLMVMSDHGFTSFRRGFNLNTWLLNQGYAEMLDPLSQEETEFFNNIAWDGTKAYGLGINSLYLNMAGREAEGIVTPGEASNRLIQELSKKLLDVTDPLTGEKVIARVYHPNRVYSGPFQGKAPDLVLGYNRHYRSSWSTILGEYPLEEFVDNDDKWSGDHCMAHVFLPGIFLCNQKFQHRVPALYDLAPSILDAFGLKKPEDMIGKTIFG
jgi:predicted AlkP superfamily phosphohydrolase/phosphomutase